MKEIKIRTPFYGAGSDKQYGWAKDGYHIYGIGLKVEDIKNHEYLSVEFEGEKYLLKCEEIKSFTRHYKSFYTAKGVQLAVISKSLLNNILLP